MLTLLALIPGGPAIAAFAGSAASALLRCKACLIALAIGAALVVGDIHGTRKEAAKWDAANLAEQLKASQRDAAIQKDTADQVRQQAAAIEQQNSDLSRKVADYEIALATRPDPCKLNPDDVRRLHDIR